MSNVAIIPNRPKSVTMDMADRYGMDHVAFERTLRGTVFPAAGTPEEFAAFLLVAKEHKLNPVTKEIYAFPKRGGGIVPIVSIDGWLTLINSHPQFDGMDCDDIPDGDGELSAMRCTIYRKDRSHPVRVTEYLSECYRATDPWKMKHRMLRHKATIQCARYAFGFAGIYDEDEGQTIAANRTPAAPMPPAPPAAIAAPVDAATAPEAAQAAPAIDFEAIATAYEASASAAATIEALDDAWLKHIDPIDTTFPVAIFERISAFEDKCRGQLEL